MCQFTFRRLSSRCLAVVMMCTLAWTGRGNARAAEVNPALVLPEQAFGYVHIQVESLSEVPTFGLLTQLFNHVSTEASVWSTTRLGVDITTLTHVTVIVPPFEQLMAAQGSGNFPICLVAKFSKSFRVNDFAKRLPEGWQLSPEVGERCYVRGEGEALHVPSNTSLVFGTPAGVTWWMSSKYDDAAGTITELLNDSLESGHVLFGADLAQVPDDFFASFPPAAQWLANTNFASIDIFLDDEITFAGYFYFDEDAAAVEAESQFQELIDQGSEALSALETETSQRIKDQNTSTEDAFGNVVALAVLRQGAETLENIEITHEEETVSISLSVEQDLLVSIASAMAITRQIGEQEKSRFQDVADQLGTGTE